MISQTCQLIEGEVKLIFIHSNVCTYFLHWWGQFLLEQKARKHFSIHEAFFSLNLLFFLLFLRFHFPPSKHSCVPLLDLFHQLLLYAYMYNTNIICCLMLFVFVSRADHLVFDNQLVRSSLS